MIAHIEVVTEGTPDRVITSTIERVPASELEAAKQEYAATKVCLCSTLRRFVEDERGWPYDYRQCAVCGRGLGTV